MAHNHEELPEIPLMLLEDIAAGKVRPDPVLDPEEECPEDVKVRILAFIYGLETEDKSP